jgi:hypothetical protein
LNKRNKFFYLKFRDIEDLIWRAILKQKKESGFSNSWLRTEILKIEKRKEPEKEAKP